MPDIQSPVRAGHQHDQSRTVSVSDETFTFRDIAFDHRESSGAQIAMAAGAHPVEDFVILAQLETLELESVRPTETANLDKVVRLFVIKGSGTDRFFVDGLAFEWPCKEITGLAIRKLTGHEDDDIELLLERSDEPDRAIGNDDVVRIGADGAERLKTRPAKPHVTIKVDGEPFVAPSRHMTPNEIIVQATGKDPATHHLVQITKHERISYQGKGNDPIRLREGMRFQVVSTGPTPVSDPQMKLGAAAFMEGLRALGYDPAAVPGLKDHIAFDYTVECGRFAGTKVRLGLVVPVDFPMSPPTGPYITPEIHPINPNGAHPLGAVHKDQARPFDQATGARWQYWSRPFPNWATSKRSVAAYMSHIWQLWDSQ